MKKYKRQPVKASTKPAPKRAIKASGDSDDIVMYLDGKKVYEGDIRDIDSAIAELCKDEDNNQIFMEYLNQFGDPFDFDGTPEDTARTFAWWVAQDFDEVTFAGEDFYVQDSINGKSFEIFRKSDEAVEGSVQRRAKNSVKASNNKRGGNAMKMYRGKRNVNASNRPAPRRSIKADEYYPENYADMGYEGLDDAITAMEALMTNLEDLKQVVSDYANQFEQWQSESDRGYRIDATPMEEMFSGPDDAYYFAEKVGEIADTVAQCERDFYDLT